METARKFFFFSLFLLQWRHFSFAVLGCIFGQLLFLEYFFITKFILQSGNHFVQVLLATLSQNVYKTYTVHFVISEYNTDVLRGIFGGYHKPLVLNYVNVGSLQNYQESFPRRKEGKSRDKGREDRNPHPWKRPKSESVGRQ